MAKIVLGMGTSHSPLLTFGVETWLEKADDDKRRRLNLSDGRMVTYEQLQAIVGVQHSVNLEPKALELQRGKCEQALDRLGDELQRASPDVVVIVGDDQGELFSPQNIPSVAVFYGRQIVTHSWGDVEPDMPDWKRAAAVGYGMDTVHRYPGAPEFSTALIEGLIARDIDLGAVSEVSNPKGAGFGHAFGFVVERLFRGRAYPIAPILLNTYFPPNVPSASRCYTIGAAVRAVIESLPDNARVAIIASGGLSHFVTDEVLDRGVLAALQAADVGHLKSIPGAALRSGSSEILNWVLVGGAVAGLKHAWTEYVPVYRTPAGTGIGMGFMAWR